MTRLWVLLSSLLLIAGCSLLKLDRQMQEARQELLLIAGQLESADSARSALVVLLDEHDRLVSYRIAAPGESFYFNEAPASYQLLAFDDRNGNFILDKDEPRHWLPQPRTSALQVQPEAAERARLSRLNRLHLGADDLAPAPAIDLSLALLYREQPRMQRNYLQTVRFADPRFDEQSVQLGAWQPLNFMRELGYGLYLLEPWDNNKEPLFLVHGINSSPRVWQELADDLDLQRFQLVLFHYPSGLPLNNSAYMLSLGIRDVQLRHGPQRMHVLAHSMGGLVARRALQLLGDSGDQRLCLFITLATPWAGHPAAASGLEQVPLEVPVWRDMAPGSAYLQQLFASPLAAHIRQWLLVSYAGNSRLLTEPNDGVVPLASELHNAAQDEAERLYLLDEDHNSILRSARSGELIERALHSLPAQGCQPIVD